MNEIIWGYDDPILIEKRDDIFAGYFSPTKTVKFGLLANVSDSSTSILYI